MPKLSKTTLLEKDIEREVSDYAMQKKCMVLKLNVWGRVGWPDRLFIYPIRRLVFIEFKLPGQKPRKIQEYIHGKLREYGFWVVTVDNIVHGKGVIDLLTGDLYEYRVGAKEVSV